MTPRIAVTIGDPSGIGPEIVARALQEAAPELRARVRVYGDETVFARTPLPDDVDRVAVTQLPEADCRPGHPTAAGGAAQMAYLEAALRLARGGAAMVTAPVNKAQIRAAGFDFIGHTELLAARLGAEEVVMMFEGPRLRVALATTHMALAEVPRRLTPADVARAAVLGGLFCARQLGIARPRIGVCGLNPHAGENGMFGDEEARIVGPGIELARERLTALGVTPVLEGPLVPDAAFRAPRDLTVALYHDQGLIPVKLLDFEDAVNVTLGLPVIRTSPDHGVAYDIAGTGRARPRSFAAALSLAARLSAAPPAW